MTLTPYETICIGDVFDTAHEKRRVALSAPDPWGQFVAIDTDGVQCIYGVRMIRYIHPGAGITAAIIDQADVWQLSREHPDAYYSWQYLVANGETMRSFADHLKHFLELETD